MSDFIYTPERLTSTAKALFKHERAKKRLDGWFIAKEAELELQEKYAAESEEVKKALILSELVNILPLDINENQIFAGTQDDGFARSYALINPSFKVEGFSGYCDPTAVFGDIEPNEEFTADRIEAAKKKFADSDYAKQLAEVYSECENYTKEVIFFVEQVTGHLIPDYRYALKHGLRAMIDSIKDKDGNGYKAFAIALENVISLAHRYADIAEGQLESADGTR